MEFPVRCFSCGSVIGHLYDNYVKLKEEKGEKAALDELKVERYCCRRMFVSYVDIMGEIIEFHQD
ncbi:MAG: DNA-directed RNA polymerase subunit N [Candidatus Anstonellales archaeon]